MPDPVFAEGMVGPGVAIEPQHVQTQTVLAPADGVIGALHPHAFALELSEGRTILVHLGIDTVGLAGQGFTLHVDGGQTVRAGDRLVTWSPVDVSAAGLPTICPVVALQADPEALHPAARPTARPSTQETRCSTGPDGRSGARSGLLGRRRRVRGGARLLAGSRRSSPRIALGEGVVDRGVVRVMGVPARSPPGAWP